MTSVSIIIPVFNDQDGIERCLRCIPFEPFSQIEVIVVDNGSCPPISLTSFGNERIKSVVCEKPGSYSARNAGVRVSTGDVLVFIDADCWPESGWLNNGLTALLSGAGQKIIGGPVSFVMTEKKSAVALYQIITGFDQEDNIHNKGFSVTANLFCTKEQFLCVGPFSEDLFSGGDREWCWRAIKKGYSLEYAKEALVYTYPRVSLSAAIRQARRVAAGRKTLEAKGLAHIGSQALAKKRGLFAAVFWILTYKKLSLLDRIRVLFVATLIRIFEGLEKIRLQFSSTMERR